MASSRVHDECVERGVLPIIPLRMTSDVLRDPYEAPECDHGLWTFAGADFKRKATKWRCPTGECKPKAVWRKASRRHADLTMLARLSVALARARAVPLAA